MALKPVVISRKAEAAADERGGAADARRSRRLLPADRALRHGRPVRDPHLGAGAGAGGALPAQSLRRALHADHGVEPGEGRSRRQHRQRHASTPSIRRASSSIPPSTPRAPTPSASSTPTRSRAWRSPAWRRGCCRSRRSRCASTTASAITTTKASPTISTSARGWCASLGKHNALILRNHGLLTCGPTVGVGVPDHAQPGEELQDADRGDVDRRQADQALAQPDGARRRPVRALRRPRQRLAVAAEDAGRDRPELSGLAAIVAAAVTATSSAPAA